MFNYDVVIANDQMLNKKFDDEIMSHNATREDKEKAIRNSRTRVTYYGLLNGKIIAEATAIISSLDQDMQNKDGLVGFKIAYLTDLKVQKEYQSRGYFSELYKFIENDLRLKGFKTLTVAVEQDDFKAKGISKNWGFTNFIKTGQELCTSSTSFPIRKTVEYYSKNI